MPSPFGYDLSGWKLKLVGSMWLGNNYSRPQTGCPLRGLSQRNLWCHPFSHIDLRRQECHVCLDHLSHPRMSQYDNLSNLRVLLIFVFCTRSSCVSLPASLESKAHTVSFIIIHPRFYAIRLKDFHTRTTLRKRQSSHQILVDSPHDCGF